MFLGNNLIINGAWWSALTGTYSVTQNQLYDVRMEYTNISGNSGLILSWSYTGQSLVVVPSSALYSPTYILSSPFNVTVTCPAGKLKLVTGGIPEWIGLCGNSKRDSEEEWDDGNTEPTDGWSDTWKVNNGYACTGGSSTTVDICSKFNFILPSSTLSSVSTPSSTPKLTPNQKTSQASVKQSIFEISTLNQSMALFIWILVFIWLVLDIILGIMTDRYPPGVYVSIEHIQFLIVLPILGSYFTKNVNGLFKLMKFAFLGFDFIIIRSLFNIERDFDQTNETLEYLGFVSGSGFVNIFGFVWIGLLLMVTESIIYVFVKIWFKSRSWSTKCIKIRTEFKNWVWLGYHIRYIMLGFLLILVSTISEINSSSSKYSWSWWLSIVIIILLIVVIYCNYNITDYIFSLLIY